MLNLCKYKNKNNFQSYLKRWIIVIYYLFKIENCKEINDEVDKVNKVIF